MTSRPVHDGSRTETGSTRPVSWRKSRHSATGARAACLEATLAVRMPDGSIAVELPDQPPVVIVPAPVEVHVTEPPVEHDDTLSGLGGRGAVRFGSNDDGPQSEIRTEAGPSQTRTEGGPEPVVSGAVNTGGHGGIVKRAGGLVLEKDTNATEDAVYSVVRGLPRDNALRLAVPESYELNDVLRMEGKPPTTDVPDVPKIFIENMTHGMNDAHVLDIKIGGRTASRHELQRYLGDWSARVKKTKLKFADAITGSSSRDYRVVGGTGLQGNRVQIGRQSEALVRRYVEEGSIEGLAALLRDRVREIGTAVQESGYALIAASVLTAVDHRPDDVSRAVGVKLIDFAHAFTVDDLGAEQHAKYMANFQEGIKSLADELNEVARGQPVPQALTPLVTRTTGRGAAPVESADEHQETVTVPEVDDDGLGIGLASAQRFWADPLTGGDRALVGPDSLGADIGRALRGGDPNFIGRAFVANRDQQDVLSQHFAKNASGLRDQRVLHVQQGRGPLKVLGASKPPWVDEAGGVYVAQVHQGRGVFTVPMESRSSVEDVQGSGRTNATGFGQGLNRRPSLANLGDKAAVVLVSCESARAVDGGVAPAQTVARETGRVVYAPTTDIYVSDDGFALANDAFGRPGQWMKFYPDEDRAPEVVTFEVTPVRAGGRGPSLESSAPSVDADRSLSGLGDDHDPIRMTRTEGGPEPVASGAVNTGGHGGIVKRAGGSVLEKDTNTTEDAVYSVVRALPRDNAFRQAVPESYELNDVLRMEGKPTTTDVPDTPKIFIENMTHGMNDAHVLDIKIGGRTASRHELQRYLGDWSARVKKTKLKFADAITGSSSRDYRVVGGTGLQGNRVQIGRQSEALVRRYVEEGSIEGLAALLRDRVREIGTAVQGSGYALIAASVLMAVDHQPDDVNHAVGVKLIDFAHAFTVGDLGAGQHAKYMANFQEGIDSLADKLNEIAHGQPAPVPSIVHESEPSGSAPHAPRTVSDEPQGPGQQHHVEQQHEIEQEIVPLVKFGLDHDDLSSPRSSGALADLGWSHARWAQSWGLRFDPHAGTAHDALLGAGGIPADDHVLRQALGEHLGVSEPSPDAWSAAAAHLGASVLVLHGDGTMSAHGTGPVLVVAESREGADGAQRWVGLSASPEDQALSGLSAAQVRWAAVENRRFTGPGDDFFDVVSTAGRAADVPELDYPPQVLRDRLVHRVDTGLTDTDWHAILGQAGITAPDEAVTRQEFIANLQQGGGDESTHVLLPLVTGLHYGVGFQVVHPDGGVRTHGAPDAEPSVTLVPAGPHGQNWLSAAQVRPPLTAGAGTRPADVAGGLGWAAPHVPVTGAEDHVGPEPSDAQVEWAYDHGRRLVEIPAHPDAVYDAILRSAGGGFTAKGEYVSDPARLRELIADEVKPALEQDLGLALVVHTIYAAHTPSGKTRIDSGDAQAEIIEAIRNPGSRPGLADELVPYFANRLGLGVRTVDPSGVVGRYGSGRPVYVTWTADQDGARHWTAAPSDASRYALGSALRAPNLSDPALFLLNHAIDVRKNALRDAGTNDLGDDPVVSLLRDAQSRWLAHGPAPRPSPGEVLPESWHPDNLQATVDHLVQTAHASIGGTGEVRDAALGAGLHAGLATELFDGLFPQGIGHEPGEGAQGRAGVAGLPADQWIVASLPEVTGLLPRGGAALLVGGDRTVVVADTPYGHRVVEFGADRLGGPITGRVGVPTSEHGGGDGLALIVDGEGHPVSADRLSEEHEYEFDSAAGWSFGPGFTQADPETGAPLGVSGHQADWAEQHGAGFVPAESGPNAVFDAAIKAAGGVLSAHGLDVTDATQLRRVLAEHLREKTAAPATLRDFPPVHAAFAFEGVDRVIEEFFDQDPRGANPEAVHLQLDEHINSGKAAAYVVEAMAEPGRWEHVTQAIALDVIADWAGRGVLAVDPRGQVRLHGDSSAPRLAVGRLGAEDTELHGWVALTPEHAGAESFDDAAVHAASSLTPPISHIETETGADSFYHAVLDASGGAIQIDRDTLVSTPAELKQQLTSFLLERPDVLDADTRQSIERTTGIGADEGVGKLIDALADPTGRAGEEVARHLIGGYLGRKLTVVEPDGSAHSYGSGRPVTVKSVAQDEGESRWAALPLESRNLDLDPGHDLGQDEDHGASTVRAERVEQAQWAPSTHTLKAPDEVAAEDPWRSATFCVVMMVDGVPQKACVSVAVLTLDAALAAELGVAMR
jgi:Inositol polyphosphate kinase